MAEEERHGYGIMQDVARQTDGGLELGPGTLYGCLKRMLAAGLVEESDERRRYYRMTTLGKRTVRTEAQRLAGAVMVAMARLVRRLAPHHGPGESLRPLVRRPQTRQA